MSWFKIDDTLGNHPKARAAGLPAMGLWAVSGSYCAQYLTDGLVPDWFPRSWTDGDPLAKELVAAGLWTETEHGYQFHDWHSCNPTREQVLSERDAARQRKDRWREKRSERETNTEGTPAGTRSERVAERGQNDAPTRPDPTRPVLPTEELQEPETETRSPAAPRNTSEAAPGSARAAIEAAAIFLEFWSTWPRHDGKKAALAAWRKAIKGTPPEVIIAAAARFAADPNREPAFTPLPATWLNGERWNDGPLPDRNRNGHRPTTTDKVNEWLTLETPRQEYNHQPLEIE